LTPDELLLRRAVRISAFLLACFVALAIVTSIKGADFVLAIETGNAMGRGRDFDRLGRLRAATVEYRRLLEIRPEYLDARAALVRTLLERKMYPEALEEARALTDAQPENAEYQSVLGDAFVGSAMTTDAVKAYNHALALKDGFPDATYGKALALAIDGDTAEARTVFQSLTGVDLNEATAAYSDRFPRAKNRFDKYQAKQSFERQRPADVTAMLEWHLKNGRVEDALALYIDAEAHYPKLDTSIPLAMALDQLQKGRP
jgi:tetratricopeptide (TPR) repeat protein